MNIGAHPLVVAVALGFLNQGVLIEEREDRAESTCATCDCDKAQEAACDRGEDAGLEAAEAWIASALPAR